MVEGSIWLEERRGGEEAPGESWQLAAGSQQVAEQWVKLSSGQIGKALDSVRYALCARRARGDAKEST